MKLMARGISERIHRTAAVFGDYINAAAYLDQLPYCKHFCLMKLVLFINTFSSTHLRTTVTIPNSQAFKDSIGKPPSEVTVTRI